MEVLKTGDSLYDCVSVESHNLSKSDLVDLIKELTFAIQDICGNQVRKEILLSAYKELKEEEDYYNELWGNEYEQEYEEE